jgi:indole-3-acetate monooxygenase
MSYIAHPSAFISSSAIHTIRQHAAEAEQLGRLHRLQLAIIYEKKWFNLFVPATLGGLELTLPEALRIQEGLAWADGSTGWTVTLCSGANWFIGFLNPELTQKLFSDPKVCFAGSGKASGIAKLTGEGFEVSGFWRYATGASHATALTANCVLEKDGITLENDDGSPKIKSFLFFREETAILEDWNLIGMNATASHSFEVKKLFVARERCFEINDHRPVLANPIYQVPFLQFAEATLAVNSSGMAMHFLDLCEKLFTEKEAGRSYPSIDWVKNQLQEARQSFYQVVQHSWAEMASGVDISGELLMRVSSASRTLSRVGRELVDTLYPYCGLIAADPATEINRVWRDLHTASQHSLLNFDAATVV